MALWLCSGFGEPGRLKARIGVHSGFADREPGFGGAKWERG